MANKNQHTPAPTPGTIDEELESLAESVKAVHPQGLPDDLNELHLLRRNVSDAIALLADFASTLRAECDVHSANVDNLKSMGYDPLIHLPELPVEESTSSPAIRWDWIGNFLSGPQQLGLMLLRKALSDERSKLEKRHRLLLSADVLDQMAAERGIQRPPEITPEEFRQRIARNFSTAARIDDDQNVIVALEISVHAFKELEACITEKQENAEYLLAGWKSPKEWLRIFGEHGQPMVQKTFRRKIDRGEIRTHPDSTTKRIAIHKSCLPLSYVESLTTKLP